MTRVIVSILLCIILALTALQIPYVQTKLIHATADYITEKTGFPTSIKEIHIQWFDRIRAKGVKIQDPDGFPMIHAADIFLDFELSALWQHDEKVIDYVEIDSAKVYARITLFDDTLKNLNLTEFFNRIRQLNTGESSGKIPSLIFDEVVLTNSIFIYQDTRKEQPLTDFNYNNFNISQIDAHLYQFNVRSDTIQMQIETLNAFVPANDLPIHSVTGQFRYSRKALEFNGVEAKIGKSIIRDTVLMAYESPEDLQEFNTRVDLTGHFKNSKIHSEDLGLFVPELKKINDLYRLTGKFRGRVNNFHLSDALLELGKATKLKGEIRMEGLPNIDETFMNYDLDDSYVLVDDLRPYLKGTTVERMKALHHFNLDGRLIGFVNDFVAHGKFDTEMGTIVSDINLKLTPDINSSEYSGKLALIDFDLGQYAQNNLVGKITLNGNINGKGLSMEKADFRLEGDISSFELKDYNYKNIKTKGRFKNKYFEGSLDINDPNAEASFSGSIDLKNNEEKFVLNTTISTLNLLPLNLSKRNVSINGKAVVNAAGLALDSILGEGIISSALIKVDEQSLPIDTLSIYSLKSIEGRKITLNSDLVNLSLEGQFVPTLAYKNIKQLLNEYLLTIKNNSENIDEYYASKNLNNMEDYNINLELTVNKLNPLLNLFEDSLYIAPETTIKGNLTGGFTSVAKIDFQSDSIQYRNNAFKNTLSEITLSKTIDNSSVLGAFFLKSEKQQIGKAIKTQDLVLESTWNNDLIDFNLQLDQQKISNHVYVNGAFEFLKDKTRLSFNDSDIILFENKWELPRDNFITFSADQIAFDGFELTHGNQRISLNGRLNKQADESLELLIDSVNLNNLNPVLLKPIEGIISGRIDFLDIYEDFKVNIIASVEDFKVDNFKVGDITATTFYNNLQKKSDITFLVNQQELLIGSIKGTYEHKKENDQLKLDARLQEAPLYILEPFFDAYFSSVQGTATGNVKITGTPLKPILDGQGKIDNGGLSVNYLNTFYKFSGDFSADQSNINFHNLTLVDEENNLGGIDGSIKHDFFKNWALDINGQVNKFLVLNTTAKDNEMFYGTGYGTGSISFKGDVNNLMISAKAKTEPGTRIFIPIGESNDVEQQEFINFVSFNDTTSQSPDETSNETDLSGISLDLALEVTTDAYSEIIFDIKSGDIIRGRGEGDLRLALEPTGEFSMFGDFFIREGGYNFTLYNIINKEFDILPDSRISWYGDPYQGQMNIKASYKQLASLKPIIPEVATLPSTENLPVAIKRQYISTVLMDLNGPLLLPNIDFDIEVEGLPNNEVELPDGSIIDMNLLFSRFKERWDEQEFNRQVFSLIVLRRFSPLQSFSTEGSLVSSVSELLSNQLSYWVTQVDENLEIDLNLGSLDEEAFNTFQLRLSYTMLDGRLRIVRDGGFTNPYDNSDSKVPGIIGDWTVEYLLTPDGKLRVKMYNRTNYNTVDLNQSQNSYITTGFSIQHTQSFDEIKELFRKSREKSQKKSAEENVLNDKAKTNEDEVL